MWDLTVFFTCYCLLQVLYDFTIVGIKKNNFYVFIEKLDESRSLIISSEKAYPLGNRIQFIFVYNLFVVPKKTR